MIAESSAFLNWCHWVLSWDVSGQTQPRRSREGGVPAGIWSPGLKVFFPCRGRWPEQRPETSNLWNIRKKNPREIEETISEEREGIGVKKMGREDGDDFLDGPSSEPWGISYSTASRRKLGARLSHQISLLVLDPYLQPTCSWVFGFPAAICGFCILFQPGSALPRKVFLYFSVLTAPAFSSSNFWWIQNQAWGERRGQGIGNVIFLE